MRFIDVSKMGPKNNIILDMASNFASVEEIFLNKSKTAINKDAITAAMLYISIIPSYEAPKFGISEITAIEFYKKFDKLDDVQIKTILKTVELVGITKIEEYAPHIRKELTEAISAIRKVENAYGVRLIDR